MPWVTKEQKQLLNQKKAAEASKDKDKLKKEKYQSLQIKLQEQNRKRCLMIMTIGKHGNSMNFMVVMIP